MRDHQLQKGGDLPHASLPPRPRGIDYRELRRRISIIEVLELISWKPATTRGPELRGPCPLHKSSQPTSTQFVVNTARNIFYCHSSKCKTGGNQLDLWMKLTDLSVYDAALDLAEKTGTDVPWIGSS